jgi:hypothetical protein
MKNVHKFNFHFFKTVLGTETEIEKSYIKMCENI